jgi:PEP-CTERM motif
MNSLYSFGRSLLLGAALAGLAHAGLIFDRGLPNDSSVNNAAGASRSNVSWQSGFSFDDLYYLVGDDFSFSGDGVVDSITVYEVANNPVDSGVSSLPGDEFANLTLYYGPVASLDQSSSTYDGQLVTYPSGAVTYQGFGGAFYDIYAITFSGLNFNVTSGTLYGFALDGTPSDQNDGTNTLLLHASNAALSGTPQQGADNLFRYYTLLGGIATFDSFCDTGDEETCGGWDKSSDINVQINGTIQSAVPEPSSLGLMAFGLAGLLAAARKRFR